MTERLYTLSEARKELLRIECEQHGHDLELITVPSRIPVGLSCTRCGKQYRITPLSPESED